MRKCLLVLAILGFLTSCGLEEGSVYPRDVEFLVTGTKDIAFTGSCGNRSSSSSVDGVTPQSFYTKLENDYDMASGNFQKLVEGGTLMVEVYVDQYFKKDASTWAAYGEVRISYPD